MKQENELYSEGQYPTTMALTKTIVQKRDSRTTRERMHTARGDETGEAMTTKKHVQAIVRQLGLIALGEAQYYWEKERKQMTIMQEVQEIVKQLRLIDLGEAQQYWGNETIEKDVNVEVQNALPPRQTRSSERIDESDHLRGRAMSDQNWSSIVTQQNNQFRRFCRFSIISSETLRS